MLRLALTFAVLATLAVPLRGAVIVVDTTADTDAADGFCSLREAIFAANLDLARNECPAGAGDDRIRFQLTLPATITLVANLPQVSESVAVEGPGRAQLSILGASSFAVFIFDGPGLDGGLLRLADLTIADAFRALQGGAALSISAGDRLLVERVTFLENLSEGYGGAVEVLGASVAPTTAVIVDTIFDGNSSSGFGGGALRVHTGTLRIEGSTFDSNEAPTGSGGALAATSSDVTIERSTFSGNGAEDFGGAIDYSSGSNAQQTAALTLRDCTITGNRGNSNGDALGSIGGIALGGSLAAPGTFTMRNTIVAANLNLSPSGGDRDIAIGPSWTLITTGWNLIGDPSGSESWFPSGTPNGDADFVGTSAAPLDPLLESLASNGGGTPTQRPIIDAGSLVIDHGFCPDSEIDQRGRGGGDGAGRIQGVAAVPNHAQSDGCDIGAVERNAPVLLPAAIFTDGFEWETTLLWSEEVP